MIEAIYPHHYPIIRTPRAVKAQRVPSRRVSFSTTLIIGFLISTTLASLHVNQVPAWNGIMSENRDAQVSIEPTVSPSGSSSVKKVSLLGTINQPYHGQNVPSPDVDIPIVEGQLVVVSLNQQWLWAYYNGQLVYATPVTTGRPQLATPSGTYHVLRKRADIMFYSPWPKSSPFYYEPEHINYALYFRDSGFYIHDAEWRQVFGPGSNVPHSTPAGDDETGSHGCVNVSFEASKWLYNWADIGATIVVE
jgi:lipoprotein-anchoring transpeptidase ErfK/SrfK